MSGRIPYKQMFTQAVTELEKHLKASDVPNLKILGEALKKLRWPKGGVAGIRGYYLKLKGVG